MTVIIVIYFSFGDINKVAEYIIKIIFILK